jgi:hypothetical protein
MKKALWLSALACLLAATPARSADKAAIDGAVDRGIAALRGMQRADGSWVFNSEMTSQASVGATALAALTLLECGVPSDDPQVVSAARFIRSKVPELNFTYSIAIALLFLDRLGNSSDRPLIESLAARLVAGQHARGDWAYLCPEPVPAERRRLSELVAGGSLPGADTNKSAAKPGSEAREFHQRKAQLAPANTRGDPLLGRPDNSTSLFAALALWVARRHDLPVDRAIKLAESHFRESQHADGGWPYEDQGRPLPSTPTMTCAGALVIAFGLGVTNERLAKEKNKTRELASDGAVKRALQYLSPHVGVSTEQLPESPLAALAGRGGPGGPGGGPGGGGRGRRFGVGGGGRGRGNSSGLPGNAFYFLWSIERVAVCFDLQTIGKKDWYDWGSTILVSTQLNNGTWEAEYTGAVDTSFALLFLRRANLASDLNRLVGRVPDPGERVLKAGQLGGGAKQEEPKPANGTAEPTKPADTKPMPTEAAKTTETAKSPEEPTEPIKGPATKSPPTEVPRSTDTRPRPAEPTKSMEKPPSAATPAAKLDDSEAGKLAQALLAMSSSRQPQEIERLRDQKGPDNTVALALALPQLSSRMQQAARDALAQRLARMSSKTLGNYLQDDEPEIRRAAVRVCVDKGKKEFVPRLIWLLGDRQPAVARSAYAALKDLTGQDFGPAADADDAARKRATDEWQAWWEKNGTTDDNKSR